MACITKIFWKRTYLFVECTAENIPNISLRKGQQHISFEVKELEKHIYRGKLNLCIAEGREVLSAGSWQLLLNGDVCSRFAEELLLNIESLANVYRYDGDKAYIITFHVAEQTDGSVNLTLKTDYMKKNKKPEQRVDTLFILKKGLNFWYQLVSVFYPKKGNRVLLMSENREEITGNLKALYERMIERGLEQEFQIDLSFRNVFKKKQSPLDWLKAINKIAANDYIFVEDYVPIFGFLNLNKKTTLVQTWHAGFGFKAVGYGRFGLEGSPNPFQSCHRQYTYGLIGNEHLKEIYSEVWGIEKESLLATGMPRLSNFLEGEKVETIKNRLLEEIPDIKGKQVITFAPTYRGSNQKEAYYDMSKIDQAALSEFCEESNSVVLAKFHPFLLGQKLIDESYCQYIIDVSSYNLNDLFYVTDVLITDYSSCFYDFLLLQKPVIFYVYDEVIYSATRGVHRPVSKVAPGKICRSFEELLDTLKNKDYVEKDIPKFMIDQCLSNKEKSASDQVIDFVLLGKKD